MGSIKIGKWEISPQSGSAGTTPIGHKLTERHTGRNKYQKLVRATFVNPAAQKEAIETLEISGLTPYLSLNTSQSEVSYLTTTVVMTGMSNAQKFKVTSSGKAITLVTNTGYTVSGNEGVFTDGFGEQAEGSIAIKVQFNSNTTTSSVTIPITVQYWNGSAYVTGATFTVIQSSADADVQFTVTPETLDQFAKEGGKQTVSISSNVAYSIELQGDTETSWVTLSKNSGIALTQTLDITASAQAVGASARELSIKFKSNVTGSVLKILNVSQAKGEDFAISWEKSTLTFTNEDLNQIKTNNLTANADWYIEENI